MRNFSPTVPKGKVRQELVSTGKIQTMRVMKEMSSSDTRKKITKAFDITQYMVLECDGSGHGLLKSSEQDMDGDYVSQRRGSLYLCECFEVNHDFHVVMIMLAHLFCDRIKGILQRVEQSQEESLGSYLQRYSCLLN